MCAEYELSIDLFDVGVVVVAFPGQTTLVLMRSEGTIPQPGQGNPYFVAGRKESSHCGPATQH